MRMSVRTYRPERPKEGPVILPSNVHLYQRKWGNYLLRRQCRAGKDVTKGGDLHVYPSHFEYDWFQDRTLLYCFGVLDDGYSVCLTLDGVQPYFWIQIPQEWIDGGKEAVYMDDLIETMNANITARIEERKLSSCWMLKDRRRLFQPKYRFERHIDCYIYDGEAGHKFAKIYVIYPQLVAVCRSMLQNPYAERTDASDAGPWLDSDIWTDRGITQLRPFTVYEAHIPFENRCLVDSNTPPCSWWKILKGKFKEVHGRDKRSLCNHEFVAMYDSVSRWTDSTITLPVHLDSMFDIEVETFGEHFSVPEENRVIQIGIHMYLGKTDYSVHASPRNAPLPDDVDILPGAYARLVLTVGSTKKSHDYVALNFDTEEIMLRAFVEIMISLGPDSIVGHNSNSYDWYYLLRRCEVLGIDDIQYLGRAPWKKVYWREEENIKGMSRATCKIGGTVVWDYLHYSLNFLYLQYNSLNDIAKEILKTEHKKDMDYALIGEHQKTEDGRTLLAEYCNHDVMLLRLFDEKSHSLLMLRSLAALCWIDMQNVLDRATEFKIMGLFLWFTRHAREDGMYYLIPSKNYSLSVKTGKGYDGATVIEAVKGWYRGIPIFTLDFTALYPSIIMERNLCFSTVLPAGAQVSIMAKHQLQEEDVWHSPRHILRDDRTTTRPVVDMEANPSFVCKSVRKGVLPQMEEFLFWERKKDNRQKAVHEGKVEEYNNRVLEAYPGKKLVELKPMDYAAVLSADEVADYKHHIVSMFVWNCAQAGKKIIMNGAYGIIAAYTSNMRMQSIAAVITREARQFLEFVRHWVETNITVANGWGADAHVMYGDSVADFTPVIIRRNGVVSVLPICNIGQTDVWTLGLDGKEYCAFDDMEVWSDGGFIRVKNLMRHKTDKTMMRVTTHTGSIVVTEDHSMIRANGETASPKDLKIGDALLTAGSFPVLQGDRDISEAFAWGLSMADVSCTAGVCPSGRKHKMVPDEIFNATRDSQLEFLRGYYAGSGGKSSVGIECGSIKVAGEIGAQGLYLLMHGLGYNVSLDTCAVNPDVFTLTFDKSMRRRATDRVKKIAPFDYHGYVYDFETETQHFHAGVGDLVVHNTDSVMVALWMEDVEGLEEIEIVRRAWKIAERARDEVNARMPQYLKVALEKISICTLFIRKKKYVMYIYEDLNKAARVLVKGSSKKRRDGCQMKRDVCEKLIKEIVVNRSRAGAIKVSRDYISAIRRREITEKDLVMMKTLRKEPKEYDNQHCEHVVLAKMLRAEGRDVRVGDQMWYMVREGLKTERVCDLVVQPRTVLDGKCLFSVPYYEGIALKESQRLLQMVLDDTPYEAKRKRQQDILQHPEWDRKRLKKYENDEEQLRYKRVRSVLYQDPADDDIAARRQISIGDAIENARKRPAPAPRDEASSSLAPEPAPKRVRAGTLESFWRSQPPKTATKRKRDDVETPGPTDASSSNGASQTEGPPPKQVCREMKVATPSAPLKSRINSTRKGKVAAHAPLFKFVEHGDACVRCNCTITLEERGLCGRHALMRVACHRVYYTELCELVASSASVIASCRYCERGHALVELCDKMACPNWSARRHFQTEYKRLFGLVTKLQPTDEDVARIASHRSTHPSPPDPSLPPLEDAQEGPSIE